MQRTLLVLSILSISIANAQRDTLYNRSEMPLTKTVCVDSVCKEMRCDHGLDLHTFEIYNGDGIGVTSNSGKTHGYYLGTLGVQLTLFTEENQLWKNGKFSLFMINNHGETPSASNVGDLQVFDNMEAPSTRKFNYYEGKTIDFRNFFYTFYYEHTFKNFRILAGQYDINYDMANANTGFNFINSSFGASPAITVNVPSFSTYPFTSLTVRGEYNKGKFYYRSSVSEGTGGDQFVNLHGNSYNFQDNEGVMLMNEAEIRNVKGDVWKSSVKLGMWNHTGKIFYDRTDTTGSTMIKGNNGIYLIADKILYFEKQDSAQGLSGYFVADWVPGRQNFFTYSIGGGLSYCGLLKKRPEDRLSLGAFFPMVNKELVSQQGYAKTEIEAEINYNIKMNAFINLQPCVQYIYQPGAQVGVYNPFAFLMRLTIRNGLFN